jgi:predicted ester cyclase
MSVDAVERNIDMVRRLESAFNRREYSRLGELLAAGFEGRNPGANQVTLDGLMSNNEHWHAAFPDKWTEVTEAFGEGDKVVARIRDRGTNIFGVPWFGIPANGRKMDMWWLQ